MAQEIQPAKGNHKECCDSGGCTTHAKNHSVVSTPRTPAEASIDTIYKACAYGDVDKLHQFVEANPALIGTPDPQGYHCLQWGALNNRVAVCSYLIEKGADVNAIDKAGQTALHWAAVRGSLAAAETILRANGNIEIADSRGYTVCHVAAQYGQSKFIYHVSLHWQADFEKTDKDGRTSLHWAAYKGFGDIIRLLIFMDAHVDLTDKEGCTPLHWAAIVGNGEAATLLLQGGSVDLLNSRDVTGSTPWELATEKGHRFLGMHLKEWKEKHKTNGLFGKKGALGWVTSTQLCPIIWVLILGLLLSFVFTVINTPAFPRVTASVALWAYSVLGFAFTGLYFLYKTTTTDPGFIPKGTEDAHGNGGSSRVGDLTNTYDNPALRAAYPQEINARSCAPARISADLMLLLIPRCVEHFDHYCPWVGNCIGKGNRHLFFIFLALETYALLVSAAIAILRVHDQAGHPQQWRVPGMHWTIVFIVVDLFILISVVALTISQGVQIAKNVTTNEMANWYRYKYLKRPDGTYRNPFDKGLVRNCMEVLVPNMKSRTPVLIEDPADLESGQLLAKTDDRRTA